MTKRLLCMFLVVFASSALRASPPIGAVVQSSDYDGAKGITTVHIVNASHKDISALSLAVRVTLPDGTLSRPGASEVGVDFMEGIIQGKGGFAPGATFDQEIRQGQVQATVDMVAYADGTADVLNDHAFTSLIASRKARVRALQKVDELLNNALADPAEHHPNVTVAAQLKVLIDTAKKTTTDEGASAYGAELQAAVQNITNLGGSPRLAEPGFEGNQLRALIKTHEAHIRSMLPHTELKAVQP
jgi:hypothetical protein